MRASGSINLPIKTMDGDWMLDHEFYIAPVTSGLLGTDVLDRVGAVLNLRGAR